MRELQSRLWALQGQQFKQLPMFMTGTDIKSEYIPGDFPHENHESGWSQKLAEAKRTPYEVRLPDHPQGFQHPHGSGVYEAVRENKISQPVVLTDDPRPGRNWRGGAHLSNGHHRVAAADAIQQETGHERYLPVTHSMGEYEHYVPHGLKPKQGE